MDWYVSSTAYAAVPVWTASTAYTVGQFVRATAPAITARHVHRCTTAGTSGASEPGWSTTNNATTTSGGAVFTNVTGQSPYGWSAAAGYLYSIMSPVRPVAGDRVFVSSDHSELHVSAIVWTFNGSSAAHGLIQLISVNRAGSVPPVAADILSGATIGTSGGGVTIDAYCSLFWQGFVITSATSLFFNSGGDKEHYYKDCALRQTGATAVKIGVSTAAKVTLDNTTAQFGATTQGFGCNSTQPFELIWINTPSAIAGATIPTALFVNANTSLMQVTCRGVDLSAITTTLLSAASTAAQQTKVLFDSCKIASGVTRYGTPAAGVVAHDEIELVNCHNGTSIVNERHTAAGSVTTDTSTTMTDGAEDYVGAYSLKLVSSSRSDYCTLPLDGFWLDVGNTATGSSKTATVEVISSASLNNTDIKLLLEYMDTAGSSVADFVESLSSVLATSAALPTSSATWVNPPYPSITWDAATATTVTLSNGNLTATSTSSSADQGARGATAEGRTSGKYYFEIRRNSTMGTTNFAWGIGTTTSTYTAMGSSPYAVVGAMLRMTGLITVNGVSSGVTITAPDTTNPQCIAVDLDNRKIWFRTQAAANWNNNASYNPATNVGGIDIPAGTMVPFCTFGGGGAGEQLIANFGATAFAGTVPTGFTSGWPSSTAGPKQSLQATFTPQTAGRVRGLVRLGKTSSTVWIDPRITIA